MQERVPDRLNRVKLELVGEISTDNVGVRRVASCFANVVDPAGAGAGKDLAQRLCRDLGILVEIYCKLLIGAIDDKIKQVLPFISLSAWGCYTTSSSRRCSNPV